MDASISRPPPATGSASLAAAKTIVLDIVGGHELGFDNDRTGARSSAVMRMTG